jgi:DNA-binding MarR family transcriptional regulator
MATPKHKPAQPGKNGTRVKADSTSEPTTLADVIHRLSRSLNDVTLEDLRRFGMTIPRWTVLSQLAVRDGRSIGDLARATVTKQSSLTRVVDQMERDGLVRRHAAHSDHRIVEVLLTEEGRATYDEVVPLAVQRTHQTLDGLRKGEVEMLSSLLDRLLSNIRRSER